MVDTRRDRIIVFGGEGYFYRTNLAYAADMSPEFRWSLLYTPPDSPSPLGRTNTAGAYDSARDRLIVFGGFGERDVLGDTWALSLGPQPRWTELQTGGPAPSPRLRASAVYDPEGDRLLLFGGSVLEGEHTLRPTDEFWQLTFADTKATWSLIQPTGDLPGPLTGHRAIWDAPSGSMLVFGGGSETGQLDAVYQFDPKTQVWARLSSLGGPRRSWWNTQIAYDRRRDRYLVYGSGYSAPDETDVDSFTLRPVPAWSALPGRALPVGRFGQATVHDTRNDRMIVFGGVGEAGYLSDPWFAPLADAAHWTPLDAGGEQPSPRHEPVGVYDPLRHRAVFFGGWTYPTDYRDDTWVLDLADPPQWIRAEPSGERPPGRRAHAAVYDPKRNRMLVYGGGAEGTVFGDLWALELSGDLHWVQLEPSGTPPAPRYFPSLAYDPSRDRVVLFGGGEDGHTKFEVWQLTLEDMAWSEIEVSGGQLGLERHMASYDVERDRMLVFGGWEVDYDVLWSTNATFALDFDPTPHWEFVRPTGAPPESRIAHSQVFDPLRDRIAVFGGGGFVDYRNDRWTLQFTDQPTRHAWVLSSSVSAGQATIEWQYVKAPGATIAVERMEEGGFWQMLGEATPDEHSRIRWTDAGVRPGWEYSYRLRITSALGMETSGTVRVSIPGATTIDLVGSRPNPARAGEVAIWFSLPGSGDAELKLYDLRGRTVFTRLISSPSTGAQVVRPRQNFAAGIYFLELTQGTNRATRKITIFP